LLRAIKKLLFKYFLFCFFVESKLILIFKKKTNVVIRKKRKDKVLRTKPEVLLRKDRVLRTNAKIESCAQKIFKDFFTNCCAIFVNRPSDFFVNHKMIFLRGWKTTLFLWEKR